MKKTWLTPLFLLGVLCFCSCAMGGFSCGNNNKVTAGDTQTIVVGNGIAAANTATVSGCDEKSTTNSQVVSEQRTLAPFSKIDNRSVINVVMVANASTQRVVVEAQQHLLSSIGTTVDGGTLLVSTKNPFCTTKKVQITIAVPRLVEIVHAGSGDITGTGFTGSDLNLVLSGSGNVTLSGDVPSLTLRSPGSGNLMLKDLIAHNGNIHHLSSGNIQGCITQSATVEFQGSGDMNLVCDLWSLALNTQGSGNFKGKITQGTTAEVAMTGSGDVKLTGNVGVLKATIRGSGSLQADNLRATTVDVNVSGSGSAAVCAIEKVSGSRNGSGSVDVSCHPKTNSLAG